MFLKHNPTTPKNTKTTKKKRTYLYVCVYIYYINKYMFLFIYLKPLLAKQPTNYKPTRRFKYKRDPKIVIGTEPRFSLKESTSLGWTVAINCFPWFGWEESSAQKKEGTESEPLKLLLLLVLLLLLLLHDLHGIHVWHVFFGCGDAVDGEAESGEVVKVGSLSHYLRRVLYTPCGVRRFSVPTKTRRLCQESVAASQVHSPRVSTVHYPYTRTIDVWNMYCWVNRCV